MRPVNILFSAALICALASIPALGQSKRANTDTCRQEGGEVERKDNRFTGESTVTLKPQLITGVALGQQLKIALEYKIKPEERGRSQSLIPETVAVAFTSTSANRIYKGEFELVFLIDGEKVRPVPAAVHDDYSRLSTEKIMTQSVFTGMTAETLRRISRAKKVEMKLGDTEVKLSPEVLSAIRSFAACALASN